jgi:hypothetical protein
MSRRQRKKNSIHKKSNSEALSWRKGLWWKGILGVTVLLIAGVFFAYYKAIAFLHSEEFKKEISVQVGAEIGSDVKFGDFKWNGMSTRNDSFQSTGEGAIVSVDAEDISLDVQLDFLKRDKFRLADVSIGRVDTVLDLRKDFLKFEKEKKEKGFIESLLPEEAELLDLEVKEINATVQRDSGDYVISGLKLEAIKENDSYKAMIEGGEVNLPFTFLKSARLRQGELVQSDQEIYINNTQLEIFDSGLISLNGVFDFSPSAKYLYDMNGKLSGLKCKDVFPDKWHRHLEGEVLGKFKIRPHQGDRSKIEGKLEIANGTLQALPVLNEISIYLAEPKYRTLKFESFTCDFEKFRDEINLSNIKLISTGLIQVEGNLKIDGIKLDGLFDVGVPASYLENIPGAKNSVFQPGKDELLWTRVKIGGDFDNPTQDLSDRLINAAAEEMMRRAIEMGGELLSPKTMDKLKDASKGGLENLDDVLNGDKGVIEGGVDTAKGLLDGITGTKDKENPEDEKDKDEEKKDEKKDEGLIPEIEKIIPLPFI